jgi:uncharacterized protein YqjF (DUF2071 family)
MQAEWRQLVMLSYAVNPSLLSSWVPEPLELNFWKGKTFITLVGLMNRNVRVVGIPVPFHRSFEQVNLRFYVRRKTEAGFRPGVMFIKQIVPREVIAAAARQIYREHVISLPMKHDFQLNPKVQRGDRFSIRYSWKVKNEWMEIAAETKGEPFEPKKNSLERFIAERYWGYSGLASREVIEYHVEHPPWIVRNVQQVKLNGDFANFYGKTIGKILKSSPDLAFVATGSKAYLFTPLKIWPAPAKA